MARKITKAMNPVLKYGLWASALIAACIVAWIIFSYASGMNAEISKRIAQENAAREKYLTPHEPAKTDRATSSISVAMSKHAALITTAARETDSDLDHMGRHPEAFASREGLLIAAGHAARFYLLKEEARKIYISNGRQIGDQLIWQSTVEAHEGCTHWLSACTATSDGASDAAVSYMQAAELHFVRAANLAHQANAIQ